MSGSTNNAYYSCVDDLPAFDPELAKNLAYVKRYDDDVADLGLTFEWTEDVMGRMESYELREGGRDMEVTNENRIKYIHRYVKHSGFRTKSKTKSKPAWPTFGFTSRSSIRFEHSSLDSI